MPSLSVHHKDDPRWVYNELKVNAVKAFFPHFLRHTKGKYAGQPFTLLSWQEEFIENVYGWVDAETGKRKHNTCYMELSKKQGKALHVNTPIPTPDGFIRMGDLEEGDVVYAGNGEPTKVVAATDTMHLESYLVKFSDGTSITACKDHLWEIKVHNNGLGHKGWKHKKNRVTEERDKNSLVRNTEWIKDHLKTSQGALNCRISIDHKIDCEDIELPIDPYVLGVWLGDGFSKSNVFCGVDAEIASHINSDGVHTATIIEGLDREENINYHVWELDAGKYGRIKNKTLLFRDALKKLNVWNNKHIPDVYFKASFNQRLRLLQGLMDTDGYIDESGESELHMSAKRIVDDAFILARSLGIRARKPRTGYATLNKKVVNFAYGFRINTDDSLPIFRLSRKVARLRKSADRKYNKTKVVGIKEVIPVGIQPVRCIQVEHRSHTFLAGHQYIKTHNSSFMAGICLFELVFGEMGGEVYFIATTREQAGVLYNMCYNLVLASPILKDQIEIQKRVIEYKPKMSTMKILCSKVDAAHGRQPSCFVYDEIATAATSELWDVLNQSTAGRQDPIGIAITHAGHNVESFAYRLHDYTEKVNSGIIKDPHFFGRLYGASPDEDWHSEATWRKANPSMGHVFSYEEFYADYIRATQFPDYEINFKVYRLNMWLKSARAWIKDEVWGLCFKQKEVKNDKDEVIEKVKYTIDDFIGEDCWVGVDLSSTRDLTAIGVVFFRNGKYYVFNYIFCPEMTIRDRSENDKVPYDLWAKEGWIITTPGNVTDDEAVLKKIEELRERFCVREVAFDRWNSLHLMSRTGDLGMNPINFGQGFGSMSGPTKAFEKKVYRQEIIHDGNPVLRWAIKNVALATNPAGDIKISKEDGYSTDRVDPIISIVMAFGRAILTAEESGNGPSYAFS